MLDEAPRILRELQSYRGANEEIRQVCNLSGYVSSPIIKLGLSMFDFMVLAVAAHIIVLLTVLK